MDYFFLSFSIALGVTAGIICGSVFSSISIAFIYLLADYAYNYVIRKK